METNNQQKMTREEYHKIKKRKRLRPWAFWLFTILFLIAILISILILYNWGKDNQKNFKAR